MIRRLLHLAHQRFDIGDLGAVSGDGDSAGAGADVGQGIERGAGGVAGRGFARGDVDFGTSCL